MAKSDHHIKHFESKVWEFRSMTIQPVTGFPAVLDNILGLILGRNSVFLRAILGMNRNILGIK